MNLIITLDAKQSVFLPIQVRAKNQAKGLEWDWKRRARLGRTLKIPAVRFSYAIFVCIMFPTSHSRCSLPWWIHCSLACSVFSDLRKHRIAGSISFVPHGEKTLVEKGSPSSRTTKSSFIRRSANFGNVSPFFVGTTNIFSALTHLPLKLPHCTRKQRSGITGYSVHHKIRS